MKHSDDKRNNIDDVSLNDPVFCVTQLSAGWYRFVTAVGTRTSTTCVDSYKCGKANPGWLILQLLEAINLLLLPTKSIHTLSLGNLSGRSCLPDLTSNHLNLFMGNVKHLKGRINNQILEVKGLTCATPVMEDG